MKKGKNNNWKKNIYQHFVNSTIVVRHSSSYKISLEIIEIYLQNIHNWKKKTKLKFVYNL